MPKVNKKTYQLKISLLDTKPPIWRRFLSDSSVTLSDFHEAVQIIMGWTNSHLHMFRASGKDYGMPDPDPEYGDEEMLDDSKFKLSRLLKKENDSIIYEYDFGDGWEHKITLEKILPFDSKTALPVCLEGKGACPPEDVGGTGGFYNFLDAMSDQDHPEHEEFKEWVGGEFDPEKFDIEAVNDWLSGDIRDYYSSLY